MNKQNLDSMPLTAKQRLMQAQRRYSSRALFGDEQEVLIEHAGQEYRLRITRHDKLILTK